MNKTKKIILYAALSVMIAGSLWFGISYYKRAVSYEGEITASVEKEIIIQRNKTGMPHVRAGSIKDAYFSIGFLHGQDRLALIEYFRAAAQGTLSELIGESGLNIDKISRAMGFTARADEIVKKLKSPHIDYLDSYTYGINIAKHNFMEEISSSANIPPSAWTMKDVISILLLLEWSDAFLNNKELLLPLPDSLNKILLKDIIPEEYLYYYTLEESKDVGRLKKIRETVGNYIGPFSEGLAFYLSGKRIKDGKPIIGFNLNSSLNLYPKWYPVYLEIENKKIACVTASGLPFIFFGSNDSLSFAGFGLKIDTQDFCVETVKEIKGEKFYIGRGRLNKFNTIEETIYTDSERTEENAKKISVLRTGEGVIVSNILENSDDSYISIKSVSPDEQYIVSLFELPFADNLQSAVRLLKNKTSQPRVYLFADHDTAVTAYSGMVPIRDISGNIFKYNADTAWRSVSDISGSGILTESKNIIIGDQYFNLPKNIEALITFRDNNRFARLSELLENDKLNERKEVIDILLDSHSAVAEKFTPLFISILENISITSSRLTRIYFNQWDSSLKTDSVPATIFNYILINTISMTISDDLENYQGEFMKNYDRIIDKFYTLMNDGKSFIFDDSKTKMEIEDRDAIFRRAFLKALRQLNESYGPIMNEWKWGVLDSGLYGIPLARTGLFNKKSNDKKDTKGGGSIQTINAGAINAINMPGADNVLSLSGIFHANLLYLSPSFSCPMNPGSEYFKNYFKDKKFFCLNKEKDEHTLKIVPQSKKFGM